VRCDRGRARWCAMRCLQTTTASKRHCSIVVWPCSRSSDSVAKKSRVVEDIVKQLGLPVAVYACRVQDVLEDLRFHTTGVDPRSSLCRYPRQCSARWPAMRACDARLRCAQALILRVTLSLSHARSRGRLGCRNVLSFDAKPIPGLGLHHRTHWGSLIGVGVAIGIGIGIESAHRSKQPARYQSLIPTSTPTPTPTKHP
jgi:hypothetical protein